MAQTIKLKRSSVQGRVPTTSDLDLGEIAINTYDGKLYIKKNDGSDSIVEVGANAIITPSGNDGELQYNNGGSLGAASFTFIDDANNRLGLGTDTPSTTLEVSGTVTATTFDGSLDWSNVANKPDPTLTLNGDVSGSATFTDLGDATLTVTVANDSHTHDGRYYTETESDARFVNVAGDTMTGNLSFGDNNKAIFGAGSDLQIYHDGSNSYIKENGTGQLVIDGTEIYIRSSLGESYAQFINNGEVKLYYDGALKLATTSTGINVTGTVTADGLAVDGLYGSISDSQGYLLKIDAKSNSVNPTIELDHDLFGSGFVRFMADRSSGDLRTYTNGLLRHNIADNGNISFYEDTGTTPKFFWDASAESLFIGATSASALNSYSDDLVISNTAGGTGAGISIVSNATNGYSNIHFGDTDDADIGRIQYNNADNKMTFRTNTSDAVVIDSSGNVGIGTSSPTQKLHVYGSNATAFIDAQTGTSYPALQIGGGGTPYFSIDPDLAAPTTNGILLRSTGGAYPLRFGVNTTERMRIDSSGNLLVGKTASGLNTAGFEAASSGRTRLTRDSANVVEVNRTTNDGSLVTFNKDGSLVGSIASVGGTDIKVIFSSDSDQYITGNAASNYLTFSSANAERMRILGNGNVAIGQSAAPHTLTVRGTISRVNSTGIQVINLQTDADAGQVLVNDAGGTSRALVNSAGASYFNGGNVGVGTNTPLDLLHIKSNSTDARVLIDGHTGFDAELKFAENGTVKYTVGHDAASDNFVIGTTNVDTQQRFVIDSNGKVGIGRTAPGYLLDVAEDTRLGSYVYKSGAFSPLTSASGNNYIGTIDTGSNGDASGGTLEIWDGHRKTGRTITFSFQNASGTNSFEYSVEGKGANAEIDIQLRYVNRSGDPSKTDFFLASSGGKSFTQFYQWRHEGLITDTGYSDTGVSTIDLDDDLNIHLSSSGNVGIGTTAPGAKLHVLESSSSTSSNIRITNDNSVNLEAGVVRSAAGTAPDTTYISFDNSLRLIGGYGTVNEVVRITEGGNVGIGTSSPSRKVDISAPGNDGIRIAAANALIGGGASGGDTQLIYWNGSNAYYGRSSLGGSVSQHEFRTSGITRLTIASSGNVGIGTTTPGGLLDVRQDTTGELLSRVWNSNTSGTGAAIFRIANNGNNAQGSRIEFSDNNYYHSSISADRTNGIQFGVDATGTTGVATERARIDVDGNLLVGTTDTNPANDPTGTGVAVGNAGWVAAARDGDTSGMFNRLTSDGNIVTFHKDGTTVGNIGSVAGQDIVIGSGSAGLRFLSTGPAIQPRNADGTANNDAIDLGLSTNRFKDLYLSGQATVGTISTGNITTTGYLRGPATFVIDPAAHGDDTGTVVIAGNLQVDGTTTTINSTTLTVDDKNIVLASGSSNAAAANGAGITVDCGSGTDATLTYNGTLDTWEFNKELRLTTGVFAAQVNTGRYLKYRSAYSATAVADFEIKSDNNSAAVARITGTGTADLFQIFDNTSQIFTVKDGGNVGIGTTSPASLLHISSADASTLTLENTTNAGLSSLHFRDENGVDQYKVFYDLPNNRAYQHFNGNGLTLYSTQISQEVAKFGYGSGYTTSYLAGDVGIGDSSPEARLHVQADGGSTTSVNKTLIVQHNTPTATLSGGGTGIVLRGVSSGGNIQNYEQAMIASFGYSSNNSHGLSFWTKPDASTALTQQMLISNTGNVGIGTTAPQSNLHVLSPAADGSGIRVSRDGNAAYLQLYPAYSSVPTIMGNGTGGLHLGYNSNTDGIRIDTSNNVGIGTTSPLNPLHVKQSGGTHLAILETSYSTDRSGRGQLSWRDASNITGAIWTEYDGSQVSMRFGNLYNSGYNTNTSMIIRGNGSVGIGTVSPSEKLSVENSSNATTSISVTNTTVGNAARSNLRLVSDAAQLDIYATSSSYSGVASWPDAGVISTATASSGGLILNAQTGGIKFQNATTEAMRIASTGNVGIGHSSPNSKLSIVGDGGLNSYSGVLGIENTDGDPWASICLTDDIDATTAASNYYLIGRGSSHTNRHLSLHIPTAADYGSGAQPKIIFASTGADTLFSVEASTGNAYHKGNVGIGTATPEEKLHVLGQASFENAGNTNRGNIIMGAQGNGVNKWATLAGTHYNEATGSGSGSENAGVMIIGSHSTASANEVWIGHGPYEINPATLIRIGTHTATTHNLGGTTHMVVNSSGNVGIGTTSPTEPLTVSKTVSGSTTQIASLVNPVGTANTGVRLWMSGTNTTTRGTFIDAVAESTSNNHSLRFGTSASSSSPTERMRIDSDGNLLMGLTSSQNQTGTIEGVTLFPNGFLALGRNTAASAGPIMRLNSIGAGYNEIIDFRKDGTAIGSIGTIGGDMYVETNGTGIRFADSNAFSNSTIRPCGASGASRDAGVDLGEPTIRWRNLYLSGSVILGASDVTLTSDTATLATTTQTEIASFSATSYGGGKFVITAKDGSNRHIVELLVTHDGTTAVATQYGSIYTSTELATYDVDISSGNVRILATSASTNSTVYKVAETLMEA